MVSGLNRIDDTSVLEVNQAKFQSQLYKQLNIKVDSTSAPKEGNPSLILDTSPGQNNGFPVEIMVIIVILVLFFVGFNVMNLAIPALIFFGMMFFLGIN